MSDLLQVNVSPGTKKLFAATAFGAVSLLFLARHFKRRKGKKKAQSPWEQGEFDFLLTAPPQKGDFLSFAPPQLLGTFCFFFFFSLL